MQNLQISCCPKIVAIQGIGLLSGLQNRIGIPFFSTFFLCDLIILAIAWIKVLGSLVVLAVSHTNFIHGPVKLNSIPLQCAAQVPLLN